MSAIWRASAPRCLDFWRRYSWCWRFSSRRLRSASAVAQEKDRGTLILLLLTNLSNSELVLGRLLASLMNVLMLLAAAVPFFMLTVLFGGVSFQQVMRVFLVTLICALAAGSLGSTLALWREKTFQVLALTTLAIGILAAWEVVIASGALQSTTLGAAAARWAGAFSPWQALQSAMRPAVTSASALPVFGTTFTLFMTVAATFTVVVNAIAIALVRVWNPSREARPRTEEADEFRSADVVDQPCTGQAMAARGVHAAPGKARRVWDNPILWREVCTWAYGRKVLAVRVIYLALFAATVFGAVTRLHAANAAAKDCLSFCCRYSFSVSCWSMRWLSLRLQPSAISARSICC